MAYLSELIDRGDLLSRPDFFTGYIHWSGLLLGETDFYNRNDEEFKDMIEKAISNLFPEEAALRKERWGKLKEALKWQQDFWGWFREKTYPQKYQYKRDLTAEEKKAMRAEHRKLCRNYVRDYEPFNVVSPDQFTDKVPAEMRKRYKENMELIEEVKKDSWRWEERFPATTIVWNVTAPHILPLSEFPFPYGRCSSCGEALPPPGSAAHQCNWRTTITWISPPPIPKDQ